jgi:hypothetical protein
MSTRSTHSTHSLAAMCVRTFGAVSQASNGSYYNVTLGDRQ